MNDHFQQLRHRFYGCVLGKTPSTPVKAMQMQCDAWKELTSATFVWLWLYNEAAQQWEVAAFAPSDNPGFAPQSVVPLKQSGLESVVEYASAKKTVVPVMDMGWVKELDGRTFRVVCSNELQSLRCESFVCVPLLSPEGHTESHPVRAAICFHFASSLPELQPDASLLLMGRLSAARIADSYQAEQQAILVQLNTLAEKYLTRRNRYPEQQRHRYCEEIIGLIQERLGVYWVSIFYQNESRDMIQCIATTGLWDNKGNEIVRARPSDACYTADQSLTGEVFATCAPFFSQIGKMPSRSDSYPTYVYRETPLEQDESQLPWVIYPIKPPATHVRKDAPQLALGVIRCVGNNAWLVRNQPRNFDPIQIQTLGFIARQLAPVLETMAVHIERELAVTIIKHDLFSPLRMIQDEVTYITRCIEHNETISDYSLPNLAAANMIAKNLVDCLDADPEEAVRTYEPQPTGLEGDIVARVKNMLSHYAWSANRMKIVFQPIRDLIPRLYIDRNLTERVLCNLILNAVKYGKRGSSVQVLGRAEPNWYCLDVVNEGIGVDMNDHTRIFRGRYRGLNARRSGKKGLGLGLKISRVAMEKQKGRLLLTSGKKESTVFTMQFPGRLEVQPRETQKQ